jgi:hypothetical protein
MKWDDDHKNYTNKDVEGDEFGLPDARLTRLVFNLLCSRIPDVISLQLCSPILLGWIIQVMQSIITSKINYIQTNVLNNITKINKGTKVFQQSKIIWEREITLSNGMFLRPGLLWLTLNLALAIKCLSRNSISRKMFPPKMSWAYRPSIGLGPVRWFFRNKDYDAKSASR